MSSLKLHKKLSVGISIQNIFKICFSTFVKSICTSPNIHMEEQNIKSN